MSEDRIPINEFRAKTAEVLRTIKETGATYVLTSHGQPLAEIVPYGTPIRKKGKSILGAFANAGITGEEIDSALAEMRRENLAHQEAREKKLSKRLGPGASTKGAE